MEKSVQDILRRKRKTIKQKLYYTEDIEGDFNSETHGS